MNSTKLTLRMDRELVERAKRYSRKNNTSLSRLVGTYLESLTDQEYSVMPGVRRIMGVIADSGDPPEANPEKGDG